VIGDVHGHRAELVDALRSAGLVDEDATWCGATARVWFLGDFFDRGPDGVSVVELVMSLRDQAEQAGGEVHALLGNHEILTLGMHRFGDTEVPSDFGTRTFERSWRLNGGQPGDQEALREHHLAWLTGLPVLARVDDHLLMHSDTLEYFGWGDTIDEINANVGAVLAGDDIQLWWDCWRRMTTRYAFRGPDGPEAAGKMLDALGGSRIVHGHSVIADQLGVPPPLIEGPCLYADGKVLGVDGGVFVGGPCLVVPLSEDDPDIEPIVPDTDEATTEDVEDDLIDTEGVDPELDITEADITEADTEADAETDTKADAETDTAGSEAREPGHEGLPETD
jgi:hypothetical protein